MFYDFEGYVLFLTVNIVVRNSGVHVQIIYLFIRIDVNKNVLRTNWHVL